MKIFYLLIACCTVCGCNRKEVSNEIESQKINSEYNTGKFTFDIIEHYTISDHKLDSIENNFDQSLNKENLLKIVHSFQPQNLSDSLTLLNPLVLGFKEKTINKEDYPYIANLIKENYHYEDSTACQAVFADLLLFKHKNIITGFTKICYQCGDSMVVLKDSVIEINVHRLDALIN